MAAIRAQTQTQIRLALPVVRVCFFLLSLLTKQCNRDVIMRAVTIWGQERCRDVVSGCITGERKRGVAKGQKWHRPSILAVH